MSIALQWVLTSLIGLGAVYYLLWRLGLPWLPGTRPAQRAAPLCEYCPKCSEAAQLISRLGGIDGADGAR